MSSISKRRKFTQSYNQDQFLFSFALLYSNADKPECLDCGIVMMNDSMKISKLMAHQQLRRPDSVGRSLSYFENKLEMQRKNAQLPLEVFIKKNTMLEKRDWE